MTKIRVGLIGANAGHGWAGAAHVPAIQAVEALDLAAVATRNRASAEAAAEAFGVGRAFDDPLEMIHDPDIDLVSVVVKAPGHRELVMAAIAAGKAIYCEWPLGVDLAESTTMAEAAGAAGVATAIGLQGRSSPWLRQIRQLVAEGYVGRVLSTTFVASDLLSTGEIGQSNAYMLDVRNGANPLTIHGGHFLDALTWVLGEFAELSAVMAISRPMVSVRETGERIQCTSPDQVVVAGLLECGAAASVHIRAGDPGDRALLWEVQGDDGFLRVQAASGYIHWRPLLVEGAQGASPLLPLGSPEADAFTARQGTSEDPSWNLARYYADFASDIASGSRTVAGFGEAVTRHKMIDRIGRSTGTVPGEASDGPGR